jgi:hypothetical protein
MPRRTSDRTSVQLSSAWHMMAAFNVRCSLSTRPLAAAWSGSHPGEVYTTQLRQTVEKLLFKLASLVGDDCLWAVKTVNRDREQGA